nr:MAK10-like protein [Tanacetum cinerariifolium]
MRDENLIRTLGDYSKPSHEGYNNTIELLVGNNVIRALNVEQSWALLEDLALYDNKSWNDPRDFAKLIKAIALPQDAMSTFDRRLIELKNQVQRLMEAHLALTQPTQVNKVTTSFEVFSGPHDTQYCMEAEYAFVKYASSRDSMASENITSINHIEREELRKKGIKSPSKLFTLKYLSPASIIELNKNPSAPKRVHFINSIVILRTDEEIKEILKDEEEDKDGEYFNSFPTMKRLTHREWILKNPRPPWNKEKGTTMFKQNDEKITFKITHTMEIFKQTRLMGLSTDFIPLSAYEENFSHGRTHYYQSLLIGDEYRQDGGERRGIRHLIRLEKEMGDEGEVT